MSTAVRDLPCYTHEVEITLENDDDLESRDRLKIMLTALFQWMRVGDLIAVREGLADGGKRLAFTVMTTCPPHELGDVTVNMRVTKSEEVKP